MIGCHEKSNRTDQNDNAANEGDSVENAEKDLEDAESGGPTHQVCARHSRRLNEVHDLEGTHHQHWRGEEDSETGGEKEPQVARDQMGDGRDQNGHREQAQQRVTVCHGVHGLGCAGGLRRRRCWWFAQAVTIR